MSNKVATVIIPVGNNHRHLVQYAIQSAESQTVACDMVPVFDTDQKGTSYARNQGAQHVDTPFVTFLDADDTLEPTFIERCLDAYSQGHYCYTGWTMGEKQVMPLALTPYKGEGWHLVTTLIPTAAFHAVGGFDESLPGYEDADLHLKLIAVGICGTLVPEYLVNYTHHGTRSRAFKAREDYDAIRQLVYDRNGGKQTIMCCGEVGMPAPSTPGAKQDGDVLAVAMWSGIQSVASADGSRVYRSGNRAQIWVSPADILARPTMFKQAQGVGNLTPPKEDVLKLAGLV